MSKKCVKLVDSIRLRVCDLIIHRGNQRNQMLENVSHLFILPIYSLLLATIAQIVWGAKNMKHSNTALVIPSSFQSDTSAGTSKVKTTLSDYCNLFAYRFEPHFI